MSVGKLMRLFMVSELPKTHWKWYCILKTLHKLIFYSTLFYSILFYSILFYSPSLFQDIPFPMWGVILRFSTWSWWCRWRNWPMWLASDVLLSLACFTFLREKSKCMWSPCCLCPPFQLLEWTDWFSWNLVWMLFHWKETSPSHTFSVLAVSNINKLNEMEVTLLQLNIGSICSKSMQLSLRQSFSSFLYDLENQHGSHATFFFSFQFDNNN